MSVENATVASPPVLASRDLPPAALDVRGLPPAALDVRDLPPAQRHRQIFATFTALPAGSAFVLVNDHEQQPLYYQLAAEHAGEFAWDSLEQGPVVWRVRIGRIGKA